jgi:hypothetical protein
MPIGHLRPIEGMRRAQRGITRNPRYCPIAAGLMAAENSPDSPHLQADDERSSVGKSAGRASLRGGRRALDEGLTI